MKMKYIKRISVSLILLFTVSSVISCHGGGDVEDVISNMMNQKVNLNLKEMSCMRSAANIPQENKYVRRNSSIIVYVDSSICSPCNIDHFFEWNKLMATTRKQKLNLNYYYIVAPKKIQLNRSRAAIETCALNSPIYVDSAFSFRRNNSFLPSNANFHIFLVDNKMRIKVVGNPVYNDDIFKLMIKTVQSHVN